MGAGTAQQDQRRSGHDLQELCGPLHSGYEDPAQGKHLGHKGAYYPHKATPILRQAEDVQHHCPADYHLAERDAEPQG